MPDTRRARLRPAPWCWAALLLAALLLTTAPAHAQAPLRIGVITDMSGQYSDGNGAGAVQAARFAVEDFGPSVLGRPIEVIYADHQNKPDIAAGIVRQWLDTGGVDVVVEGVNSTVALAIQGVTRERGKIFLISGAGSSDLTSKDCSPTSVHWTYDTYASANATAQRGAQAGRQELVLPHRRLRVRPGPAARRQPRGRGRRRHGRGQREAPVRRHGLLVVPDPGAKLARPGRGVRECRERTSPMPPSRPWSSGCRPRARSLAAMQVTITDVPSAGLADRRGHPVHR